MKKSNTGWRTTKRGNNKFAYFRDLGEEEIEAIKSFIDSYQRYVILGLNTHCAGDFSDELDFCLALDYNFESSKDAADGKRTLLGELEYEAKYQQCTEAIGKLVAPLTEGFKAIPRPDNPRACITYVPSSPARRANFYLPRILARALAENTDALGLGDSECRLVHAELSKGKRSSKDSMIADKLTAWAGLIRDGAIELSSTVKGCVVYVIDDLYQSGTSLWSFAQYLKSVGASHVLGLVCVKSLRSTDNR